MFKRSVKIVILFLLIIIVLIGGYILYSRLKQKKQSFSANIYEYASPLAKEVVHINKDYNINEIYSIYPYVEELVSVFGTKVPLPLIIQRYKNGESILLAKTNLEQTSDITDFIRTHISAPFPVKTREYKDTEILFYSMSDNGFLVCAFYKGIFAVSRDYRPIEMFLDSDPENTFFTDIDNEGLIDEMFSYPSISIFTKVEKEFLAVNYAFNNDTIILDGYILNSNRTDSDSIPAYYHTMPYMIDLPDNICVEDYNIFTENALVGIKIFLNKKL